MKIPDLLVDPRTVKIHGQTRGSGATERPTTLMCLLYCLFVCLTGRSVRTHAQAKARARLKKPMYSMPTVKPLPTTRVNNFAFSHSA